MPDAAGEGDAKNAPGGEVPSVRRTRGAMPEPSKASRGRPVPVPVRSKPKAAAGSRGEGAAEGDTGPPAPPTDRITEAGPRPGGATHQTVSRTTRPGITQASLGGGASSRGAFGTHKVRDEDRVNVDMDVAVFYRFVAADAPERFPNRYRGKLLDISMSGAQLEGPIAPEVGRDELKHGGIVIEASFELPFVDKPLEIAARVNWIKPSAHPRSYLGLKFVNSTVEQKRTIRAFLIGLQSPSRRKFRRGR